MAGYLLENNTTLMGPIGFVDGFTNSPIPVLLNSTDHVANTNNTTTDQCAYLHHVPDPVTAMIQKYGPYVVLTFCIIAFLFGVLGNGTLLVIIIREKEMRRVTNIYLFSIALGDFLFIIVYTPFTIFIFGLKDWPFDEPTCKFVTFLQTFSMGLSVFTLKVLSWDQYKTSRQVIKSKASTLKTTIKIASGVWVGAIAFGVIDLVAAILEPMHPGCSNLVFCGSRWGEPFAKFRTILDFVVFCLIPTVIMLFFYSSLACNKHDRKPKSDHSIGLNTHSNGSTDQQTSLHTNINDEKDSNANRKREVRISVGLAILFLLCVLPMQIFRIWYFFIPLGSFNNFWYIFKIFGSATTFVNSCINPIALCVLSDQFRKYFKKYLCCIRHSGSL